MAGREEAQEVAEELHEERRRVRDAVDEERVEPAPEERPDLPERREDERLDALVHVPLVRDEPAEGAGLLVEGVRLGDTASAGPVALPYQRHAQTRPVTATPSETRHEAELEPRATSRAISGWATEASRKRPIRSEPPRAAGTPSEARDDREDREDPERDRHRRRALVGVLVGVASPRAVPKNVIETSRNM